MFALIGWALVSSIVFAGATAAAEPHGPVGTLGPAGASMRTCSGLTNCYVCAPGSCIPSGSWQSRIEGAAPGDTILLRRGTYNPSGTLDTPAGTQAAPITIANYGGEAPVVTGPVIIGGNDVLLDGLKIDAGTKRSYTIEIDRRTATPKQRITLAHLDVLGGTSEAIRIRGNIKRLLIRDSLIDGGRDNHVIKVLCDDNRDVQPPTVSCNWLPEVVITNNRFSKNRSSFFPVSSTASEDLLQFEGAGNAEVTRNGFGDNPYEDCVDWKPQGGTGTAIVFSHNLLAASCNLEGLLMHQSQTSGTTVIEGNRFEGGSLLRRVHAGTLFINNVVAGPLTVSASNLTLGHNTWLGAGNRLKFGDTSGRPQGLTVINNIFARTAFSCTSTGCGQYTATNNVRFQTSGAFTCSNCLTSNPMLDDYAIQVGSSAEDAAHEGFTVATDIDGTVRPQGAASDIGAYEFASAFPPPVTFVDFPSISLSWTTGGATSCSASGAWNGDKPTSGQETLANPVDDEFILSCEGPGGRVQRSITVTTQVSAPGM